ncbi:MAG: hypothetical protein GY888_06280, partial [Planctomycetaceae bacterium]|nr:hypothetical protein [Planctomycetaceae bacterium]
MSEVGLYEAMSTLRAVRRLRPDPIPDTVLHRVLKAATWAPTGANTQPWRMVLVKDHNVWIRHEESKKEHQLSEDGTEDNAYQRKVYWAPDATRFMLVRRRKEQPHIVTMVESSPSNQVQPRLKQHNYLKPGDRIRQEQPCLFEVSTLKQIPIDTNAFPNPWEINRYQWWP